MAGNRRDVELVVRARDEASKAAKTITAAFGDLFNANGKLAEGTGKTATGLDRVVAALTAVEAISGRTEGAVSKVESAIDRQRASLTANQEELSRLKNLQEQATRAAVEFALAMKQGADVNAAGNLRAAQQEYTRLSSAIIRLEGNLSGQKSALIASESNLTAVKGSVIAASIALSQFGNEAERSSLKSTAAFQRESAALRQLETEAASAARAKENLARFESFTGVNRPAKSAQDSFSVFTEQDRAAAALRAQIDPLAASQARYNAELEQARALHRSGAINAQEFALAEAHIATQAKLAAEQLGRVGRGVQGKPSLFGLKPYELTNLGYQINDVITQIASGTSITQTLAQQGGQILQLLPQLSTKLLALASNPFFVLGAVAFGTIALGISRAADQAERLRGFDGFLASTADGANYTAVSLLGVVKALDQYGLTAEQATAVAKTFVRDGLNPDRLEEFGRSAKDMADILGIDVVDAAKQLGDAFNGGFEGIKKLDDATNFLTATERSHIQTLFESGHAQEARTEAFRLFEVRMDEAAAKMRGPWDQAARGFENAWGRILDTIANSRPIQNAIGWLTLLANTLDRISGTVDKKTQLAEINIQMADIKAQRDQAKSINAPDFILKPYDDQLRELRAKRLRLIYDIQDAEEKAAQDTVARNRETQAKIDAEIAKSDEHAQAAAKASTAAQRAQLAYQDAYNAAIEKGGSIAAASTSARLAKERELAKIAKEQEAARKRAASDEAALERQNAERIARQQGQSLLATAGSFTGLNENSDKGALQALFKQANINVDPKMVAWCAAFVNSVLATNGLPGTGSLSARSFLTFGTETKKPQPGDITVLRRGNDPSQGHVGFFQGFDAKGNVRVLGGNQGNAVGTQTFPARDVLGFRRAPDAADVAKKEAQAAAAKEKLQDAFNLRLTQENAERERASGFLKEENTLIGSALLAVERKRYIAEQVAKAADEAAKKDLEFSESQRAEIEKTAAAYFDLQNAKKAASTAFDEAEKPVATLTALRDSLLQQIEFYERLGQSGLAGQLRERLVDVNSKLSEASAKFLVFLKLVRDDPGKLALLGKTREDIDAIILSADAAAQKMNGLRTQFLSTGTQLNEEFASKGVSAFDDFIKKVSEGRKVFRSFGESVLGFAADFLREIALMILKQTLFNALIGRKGRDNGDASGGVGGGVAALVSGLVGGSGGNTASGEAVPQAKFDAVTDNFTKGLGDQLQGLTNRVGVATAGFPGALGNVLNNILQNIPGIGGGGARIVSTGGGGLFGKILGAVVNAGVSYFTGGFKPGQLINKPKFHTGGIAGLSPGSGSALVSPTWFENAARYHGGGIAGLAPREIPIIAEQGEEILTRSDRRHVLNGGKSQIAGKVDLKVVNNIDSGEMFALGISTRSGQQSFVNFVRENSRLIKSALE